MVKQSAESRMQPKEKNRCILNLTHEEAKKFLLKAQSYCNFDLPPYLEFSNLLSEIDKKLKGKDLNSFLKNGANPRNYDDVNHTILHNKNGKYAWRPLQLIHPALYVSLVNKITEKEHWNTILKRFAVFSQNHKIECFSYPLESLTPQKDKAEQISYWWKEIEQRSIEFALDYEYLIQTDISDCYGSIYTHSIAWALHEKEVAKKNKHEKTLIGNLIDWRIQDMCCGQTNGIPQGSVLMDFIAEMALGYTDSELSKGIEKSNISDYHILRYRDDYRIFVNNPREGEKIVKILTEVLADLGLKLNQSKTAISNKVIKESIKADKLFWIGQKQKIGSLQKQLLIIHSLAEQFTNSGSLITALTDYHKRIFSLKNVEESLLPLISIITDIAFHNPKAYAISSAILSKFVSLIEDNDQKKVVIEKINKRFSNIPHTGHLQIWLQRITIIFDQEHVYEEPLCQLIAGNNTKIWNIEWLDPSLGNLIQAKKIINTEKIADLNAVITDTEVKLFGY